MVALLLPKGGQTVELTRKSKDSKLMLVVENQASHIGELKARARQAEVKRRLVSERTLFDTNLPLPGSFHMSLLRSYALGGQFESAPGTPQLEVLYSTT
jgi:hypothetical protein